MPKANHNLPPAEYLHQRLSYDPVTGALTWRIGSGFKNPYAGKEASHVIHGYLGVRIDQRLFLVHRVIWMMMTGEQPEEIDHINRNRSDNRWNNLRAATHIENSRNRPRSGVRRHGMKFRARIIVNGKDIHIGTFATSEEAHGAYRAATKRIHGEFSPFHEAN